jgi:apolipoprotein N-acyltransferase
VLLNYLLAVVSGILLFAIHPRLSLTLLAPIAVTPLVFALAREWRPRHRFLLGYVTGLVFWAGVNYWIQFVIAVHGGLGNLGGAAAFVVFCLLKAMHLGVFGLLAGVLVQRKLAIIGIPALWVGIERIPSWFSYTWLTLGNAGVDMALPMRLAPFTGVYGLSFMFAMFGTAVAWMLLRRSRRELLYLLLPLGLLFMPGLPAQESPTAAAVSVQPNIGERDDWTTERGWETQKRMEYLSLEQALAPGKPRAPLILWPEVPAPVYYLEDPPFRARLNTMARTAQAHVILGTVAYTERGAPLNSALWVSPEGEPRGRYDKMFPVPFGEYIPFPFSGLVKKITSEVGDFEPGKRVVVFAAGDQKVGAFICYESAFPGLVRRFAAAGATVFVNLSNDGYFGRTAAREQHLSLVRMRAAENRRWILRSTNDGVTASIDPAGRVVQALPSFIETAGRLGYSPHSDLTFYSRFGDVFAWGCLGMALVLLAISQVPNFQRNEVTPSHPVQPRIRSYSE